MDNVLDPAICGWDSAQYFIISDNVFGNFIYYSHLFPAFTAFLLGLFVFIQNPRGLTNRLLFFIGIIFSCWSLIDLVLWATERTDYTMFFWSILIHFDFLLYIGALYFAYAFIDRHLPSWRIDLIVLVLFLPLILFAHTSLNLLGFDFTNCWREALEGPLWQYYVYTAEIFVALWILILGIVRYRQRHDHDERRKILLVTIGLLAFLVSFSLGNITGSIEVDWELGQYGLFGMPIFAAFLTYLTVRYHTFKIKLIGAEAIVVGVGILILSMLFVRSIENVRVLAIVTFALVAILGTLLTRSVKREIEQREEIERLANRLKSANKRLKVLDQMKSEFVSIASHQLRSPLTSIRGYASMLLEGSFGKLPAKAEEAIGRIAESSRYMSTSVEDYLNVSRIQSGNMKYDKSKFNLKDIAKTIADEMRPEGLKRGLLISFRTSGDSECTVHADIGKTRQIIQNLVDNAIKYTKKGSITITIRDQKKPKRVFVDVTDTGIGMSKETLASIFEKFARAHNANDVNVTGTGLGLFVAQRMAEDMGGTVTAQSEGEGKGSTFTLELPLIC